MGAILYNTIMRQVAHRLDALVSDNTISMDTSYNQNPLHVFNPFDGSGELNDPVWGLAAMGDAILMVQLQTIEAICETSNHAFRTDYEQPSAALVHGAALPSAVAGVPIVAPVWGAVRDATSSRICTPRNIAIIQRRVDNPNGMHPIGVDYHYCIEGSRIYHTRSAVKIDAPVFDAVAEQPLVTTATGTIKVRDILAPLLVWGSIAVLAAAENAAMPQSASIYGAAFSQGLDNIKRGATSIDPTTASVPFTIPQSPQHAA